MSDETRGTDPWGGHAQRRYVRPGRIKAWLLPGWRWHVAELLNRSSRTCWSSLVDFALLDQDATRAQWWRGWLPRAPKHSDGMAGERWRLRDVTEPAKRCQAEARDPNLWGCYCGKFRNLDRTESTTEAAR